MSKEWVDITVIGSQYEEQMEIFSGMRRYRHLKMKPIPFEDKGIGEWVYGMSPENGISAKQHKESDIP